MLAVQKTWVGLKQLFRTTHHELQETTDIRVQDEGMHHADMVRNVVSGIQKVLKKESVPVKAPVVIQYPQVAHV